jgi:hypothetical protein
MDVSTGSEDYERGRADGRVEARLEGHDEHFSRLNGQIAEFALAAKQLAVEFRGLGSEIRTMREEALLDREKVKAAAEALAIKTEEDREKVENERISRAEQTEEKRAERAEALTTQHFKFTRREKIGGLILTAVIAVASVIARHYGL